MSFFPHFLLKDSKYRLDEPLEKGFFNSIKPNGIEYKPISKEPLKDFPRKLLKLFLRNSRRVLDITQTKVDIKGIPMHLMQKDYFETFHFQGSVTTISLYTSFQTLSLKVYK